MRHAVVGAPFVGCPFVLGVTSETKIRRFDQMIVGTQRYVFHFLVSDNTPHTRNTFITPSPSTRARFLG